MNKRIITLLLLAVFCLGGSAWSQTITATMTGTITDPTGAVVPNAKVVATNTATNLKYETQSNDSGLYTLVFLPVGPYTVAVELSGFKRATAGNLQLQVNQIIRVDVKLEIGEATQTVEVTGAASAASGRTGQVIEVARLVPAGQGGAARPTGQSGSSKPGSSAPQRTGGQGGGMSSGAKVALIVAIAGGAGAGIVFATMSR